MHRKKSNFSREKVKNKTSNCVLIQLMASSSFGVVTPPSPILWADYPPHRRLVHCKKKNNNSLFVFKLSKAFPNPSQSLTTHTKPSGGGSRPTSWGTLFFFLRRLKSDRALWNFERLCYRRHLFIFFLFSFASSLLSCNFVLFFLCVCVFR